MLEAHPEAEQPADGGRPEEHGAGANAQKTAEVSRGGGRAEEVLRLQEQVAGLHQHLRRQEARWSAALRNLQAQIDALKARDPELRGLDARRPTASPPPRRKPDALVPKGSSVSLQSSVNTEVPKPAFGKISPLSADEETVTKHAGRKSHSATLVGQGLSPQRAPSSQPISIKVERIESGEIVSCENGDKTLSISLRVRRAASAARGPRSAERSALAEGAKAAHPSGQSLPGSRGRRSRGPAARDAPVTEDGPTAQDSDNRSSPSPSPDGKSLTGAQTEELACPPEDTEPQVDETCGAGREIVTFSNGAEKDTGTKTTVLRFFNGDVKKILPDRRVVYYCASARTTHTIHPSGLEVMRFPNKLTEKLHPDGSKETLFPDGTVKRVRDGREETVFPDGTSVRVERNGDKTIAFSNGQRDVHTAQFKRREFPDGSVRTVFSDGRQETKDASGRVKVRDGTGSFLLDQK